MPELELVYYQNNLAEPHLENATSRPPYDFFVLWEVGLNVKATAFFQLRFLFLSVIF